MNFSKDAAVYDEANSWQFRAVRASLGTTTGLILLSVLAKQPRVGVAILGEAQILRDGMVTCKARDAEFTVYTDYPLGNVHAIRDGFRLLADHCKLSDADRTAMFDQLRMWFIKDWRPQEHETTFPH